MMGPKHILCYLFITLDDKEPQYCIYWNLHMEEYSDADELSSALKVVRYYWRAGASLTVEFYD